MIRLIVFCTRTLTFAILIIFYLASANRSPRLILDYKKLCLEVLPHCSYYSFALAKVTKNVLASLVDPLNIERNETIVEIFTPQSIADFSKDLDTFLTTRWMICFCIQRIILIIHCF